MSERERAPDLPPGLAALDRPGVPWLADGLRDHVVALLVWRLGCVHSRHALADLAALQQELLGRPFAVVAVHAPAAAAEADDERVRAAVASLRAPVTVLLARTDGPLRHFGGDGYPTLLLLDARGRVCFRGRGEPNLLRLRDAIVLLLDEAARAGTVPATVHAPVAPARGPASALLRPAGLCVAGEELWIADSGHHRLLACDLRTGELRRSIGKGWPGSDDGPAAQARFAAPAGLCALGGRLLVADPSDHLLRLVDLATGSVATVCGTGRRTTDRHGGAYGVLQGLCSPVGLLAHEGAVYCAQAGAHQIWRFDPDTQTAGAWLGTGAALLRDGDEAAAFAQPWGLAAASGVLWVADAGNGALRAVDLAHPFVRTVDATLQRPVAVAVAGPYVLVADAWRGAVLRYDGGAGPGRVVADRAHGLREPTALAAAADGRVFVADAGSGSVFELDLDDAAEPLRPFPLAGVPAAEQLPDDVRLSRLLQPVTLRACADATVVLPLPPAGAERLDAVQPITVQAGNDAGQLLVVARSAAGEPVAAGAAAAVRVRNLPIGAAGAGVLRFELRFTVRAGPEAAPTARTGRLLLPVAATAAGATEVEAAWA